MKLKKMVFLLLVAGICAVYTAGCVKPHGPLIVYSGKGLKHAVEEIKTAFQHKHNLEISIVYAGSDTLLSTINRTKKGDVFIPGSLSYIKKAGDIIAYDKYVARHVPVFAVRADNPGKISTFNDLLAPGIKLAVGNKDMCAIGKVAYDMVSDPDNNAGFAKNIVITGTTVNELLDLVIRKEVDASLVWADMLTWPEARGLEIIEIPSSMNRIKDIHVAVLETTTDRRHAILFADFVAGEGREIFKKHGFGER